MYELNIRFLPIVALMIIVNNGVEFPKFSGLNFPTPL